MTKEIFVQEVKDLLSKIYSEKGEVIYSKASTLSEGKYYLIGLNPGIYENESRTVGGSIENFLCNQNDENYYLNTLGELKENVLRLFSKEYFDYDFEKVFTTNLIFTTTKDSDKITNYKELVNICWPVHKMALCLINPDIIICIGNGYKSSFTKFHKEFKIGNNIWKRKAFGTFNIKVEEICFRNDSKQRLLIGLPHLSWIKNFDKSLGPIINELKSTFYTYFVNG